MLHITPLTASTTLVSSDKAVPWKCNGLIVNGANRSILIDCNVAGDEIDQIHRITRGTIAAYFVTHMHIDHVNNVHLWEDRGVPVYCPIPEDSYLLDFRNLLDASGSTAYGMNHIMERFTYETQGFREPGSVRGFTPGETFIEEDIVLETIPLPGHSPGHTGFIVGTRGCTAGPRVLFASDIGIDDFGPWYGFAYCDLDEYRQSIGRIKSIFDSGDYLLVGSHAVPPRDATDPSIFDRIVDRISDTERKLLDRIDESGAATLDELVLTGIYYHRSSIERMNEFTRNLYRFWEHHALGNHVRECTAKGMLAVDDNGVICRASVRACAPAAATG